MDDYLTKPLNPARVKTVIEHWLNAAKRPAEDAAESEPGEEAEIVFDEPSLRARCMGRDSLVQRLLAQFARQGKQDMDSLLAAAQAGDPAAVQSMAHRLKGAAANVSALEVRTVAAELETLAKAGLMPCGPCVAGPDAVFAGPFPGKNRPARGAGEPPHEA